MSYLPLARKYRPSTFREFVGQEAVATALANGIRLGREPRAVIFSGVRGIGKTTAARLYAKALNCDHGPTPEPCDQCDSCHAITLGSHEDVLEIDGASNTSVDDVRSLRDSVGYVPQRSKYKVYIIDEVHMLSQSAFNALLKTLEEPPRHVVFIFATTELHKLPQTIVSRCQTFYLQRFTFETICNRLKHVLAEESVDYEERALSLVAREGHGSMRDALTLLDQAIALGGGKVTLDSLKDCLTQVSSTAYLQLLAAIVAKDPQRAMDQIAELDQTGVEFPDVVEELATFCRHGFVVKGLGANALDTSFLGLDDEELGLLTTISDEAGSFDLNRIFRMLVQCRTELDGSALDRFVFENYVFEWCLDPGLPEIDGILEGRQTSGKRPASASTAIPSAQMERRAEPTVRKDLMAAAKANANTGAAPARQQPGEQQPAAVDVQTEEAKKVQAEPVDLLALAREASASTPAAVAAAPTQERQGAEHERIASLKKPFPESWRELVETWQTVKPLQARIFEETYLVEFSPEKIIVAVDPETMAGRKLLQKDFQDKTAGQFKELFGFDGRFEAMRKPANEVAQKAVTSSAGALPEEAAPAMASETLLEVKKKERIQRQRDIMNQIEQDPFTQEVLKTFSGKIETVRLPSDP